VYITAQNLNRKAPTPRDHERAEKERPRHHQPLRRR
jgi:hypothetical protein